MLFISIVIIYGQPRNKQKIKMEMNIFVFLDAQKKILENTKYKNDDDFFISKYLGLKLLDFYKFNLNFL